MKFTAVLFLLLFISSCQTPQEIDNRILTIEINKLSNYKDKSIYLESIYDVDQNIRQNDKPELDINSKSSHQHYKKMDSIDDLNFRRIDLYLKKFGYPYKGFCIS